MRSILIKLAFAGCAVFVASSAGAGSLSNTCLSEFSNSPTLDEIERWISNAGERELRQALFSCSLDRYSSSRADLRGPAALCSTIEPTTKLRLGDIYLLGALSKAAPVTIPEIEIAMEDGAITLSEKNRLCRLVEASTDNR